MVEKVKETQEEVCGKASSITISREINTSPALLHPYAHGIVQEHMQQVQSYYKFLAMMVDQGQVPLSDSSITAMEVYLTTMLEFMSLLRKIAPYTEEVEVIMRKPKIVSSQGSDGE